MPAAVGQPYDSGPPREQLTNIEDRNAPITTVERTKNWLMWMPTETGGPCDNGPPREQLTNIEDWNAPITALKERTNYSEASSFITTVKTGRPHRLMKTSGMQSNVVSHIMSDQTVRQTLILYYFCPLPRYTSTTFFYEISNLFLFKFSLRDPILKEKQRDAQKECTRTKIWHFIGAK